jgi:hypothetical protein
MEPALDAKSKAPRGGLTFGTPRYIRVKADKYPKLDDAVVVDYLYSSGSHTKCDDYTLYLFRNFVVNSPYISWS